MSHTVTPVKHTITAPTTTMATKKTTTETTETEATQRRKPGRPKKSASDPKSPYNMKPVSYDDNRPTTGRGGKYNFPAASMKLIEQDDEKRAFMAKVIENNLVFFNAGTQAKVRSDEELCERLNWFFSECARTQQLPTVEKMANAIGYHRSVFHEWENERGGFSHKTGEIIKQAKQILASMDAELAQEGKIQPVVYMFRAKNFYQMRDQQEMVLTPNTTRITTEDVAAIEAKYDDLPDYDD